jgi:hypothetical protein
LRDSGMRVWRTSERLQGEGRSWRVRDIAGVGYLLSSVFCIFPKQKYYWALEEYGFLRRFAMFLLLRHGRDPPPSFPSLGVIRGLRMTCIHLRDKIEYPA